MKLTFDLPIAARLLMSGGLAAMAIAASAAQAQQAPAGDAAQTEATDDMAVPAETEPLPDDIDFGALAVPLDMPYAALKPKQAAAGGGSAAPVWSRNDKPDGTAAVSMKQPVAPFWDMKAGVDLDVATQSSPLRTPETLPEKLASDARNEHSTGSAWMSAKAPGVPYVSDQVALEARMNPQRDARVGTAFSKSLPLMDDQFSLTLKHGYYVTQHDAIPGLPGTSVRGRSLEMDRSAQFSIIDTGTSFLAGQTLSPAGGRWLNSVGAEQKLFGGLSITGSVSETAEGFANKSLTAGFRTNW